MNELLQQLKNAPEAERYTMLCTHLQIGKELLPLQKLLEWASMQYPQEQAIIFEEHSFSYREIYALAAQCSAMLAAQGVKARDHVLLLLENSVEFFAAYFGILQIGAVVVPLNTFLQEAEFDHIFANAHARALVTSKKFLAQLQAMRALSLPAICFTYEVPKKPDISDIATFVHVTPSHNEMAVLLYTSGTTGQPKGVMLNSKNCMTNVLQSIARIGLGLERNERVFAILPLFHSFAQNTCIWASLLTGSTVILLPRIERRALLDGLARHRPTIFLGIPALYGLLCLLKQAPLADIKYFVCGGDMLPQRIQTAFELVYGRKICNGYGMTESAPVIAVNLDDDLCPTATVGRPLYGVEAMVQTEDGCATRTPGTVGELIIKGSNVMMGYYEDQKATELTLKDGMLATGDLAYFDREGRIVIIGRTKDLIAHKGLKIYPAEVENILMLHPDVLRAGVTSEQDKEAEQIPIAFVQVRDKRPTLAQELLHLCSTKLASYKVPRKVICITEELPLTSTGKVDKKRLIKWAIAHKFY